MFPRMPDDRLSHPLPHLVKHPKRRGVTPKSQFAVGISHLVECDTTSAEQEGCSCRAKVRDGEEETVAICESVLEWLLSGEEPAVRYGSLVDVLDEPEDSPRARRARAPKRV